MQKALEEELREKYNPDDIFKKRTQPIENEQVEEKSLTVVQEEKWYKKIYNLIKSIFKRNN